MFKKLLKIKIKTRLFSLLSPKRWAKPVCFGLVLGLGILTLLTYLNLESLPAQLHVTMHTEDRQQWLSRQGTPLSMTLKTRWNTAWQLKPEQIPLTLQTALILAEDKRFYEHNGMDWRARASALWILLKNGHAYRGASTIPEQVVRLLHPRPRNLWSRWLEGWEARALVQQFSRAEILQFYFNQIPYGAQRRGLWPAARYYFGRDLDTLSVPEMLALAVLPRAPGRLAQTNYNPQLVARVQFLAGRMCDLPNKPALFTDERCDNFKNLQKIEILREKITPPPAAEFVRWVTAQKIAPKTPRVKTTLDAVLQQRAHDLLLKRLEDLKNQNVHEAAALILDHRTGEILTWTSVSTRPEKMGAFDAVIVPRQPGSTLKPFLYAMALEKGWTPATIIEDAPLMAGVGSGQHNYRNYSRAYYGPLRLRQCLGNSLNTPAVRTAQFVTPLALLNKLRAIGFSTLEQTAEFYGEGLALGSAEVTLWDLTRAYAMLANRGKTRDFYFLQSQNIFQKNNQKNKNIFQIEIADLIGDILSDNQARNLEFGATGLLDLPQQTAVKTGTSNDFHDAWTLGFNDRYTVGVWMGNLDFEPMIEVSGSRGPVLVLRSLFAELNRHRQDSKPLPISPTLQRVTICADTGSRWVEGCPKMYEWFLPEFLPPSPSEQIHRFAPTKNNINNKNNILENLPMALKRYDGKFPLVQPTPGLKIARDPRIPDALERLPLTLPPELPLTKARWYVDGQFFQETTKQITLWPLEAGHHIVYAEVWLNDEQQPRQTLKVGFNVQ